jgi:hypothetical protein
MSGSPFARFRAERMMADAVRAERMRSQVVDPQAGGPPPDVDRAPVGDLSAHLDPTLRWGGSTAYTFLQQGPPAPPAPGFAYFQSNLIAQAKVGRPRTWSVLMSCTFDTGSEWAGSHTTNWQVIFQLLVGVGQANIPLQQIFTGNPVDGFTPPGAASKLAPFSTLVAFWEAVPAVEINAQVLINGDQSGSPNAFTGTLGALIAPYYPVER